MVLLKGPHFKKHELSQGEQLSSQGECVLSSFHHPTIPYCPRASITIPNTSIHITHVSWRGFEMVT